MAPENSPGHLRPVPSGNEATARALEPESGTPGLTPPRQRGRSSGFLTDVILELGYATSERIEAVIAEARNVGRPAEQLLMEGGVIDSEQLSRALAERYGLDHVDLTLYHVDMAAANLLPVSSARRYKALPIGYADQETLIVAMADPANVIAVDDIQMATGLDCQVAVSSADDIEALIARLNTLQNAVHEAVEEDREEDAEAQAEV